MQYSVEHAQTMMQDLLDSGLLMKDIIAGPGVNPTTLGWIRKGRVEKISGKTYGRIKDYWTNEVCVGRDQGNSRFRLSGVMIRPTR